MNVQHTKGVGLDPYTTELTTQSANAKERTIVQKYNTAIKKTTDPTELLKLSNNFEFDQLGIVKVSENGEIQPRTTEYLEAALEGLNVEIANSYDRCNTVYNSYQNYLKLKFFP